jgi:tetratricopeptide (TPR) repeat protein
LSRSRIELGVGYEALGRTEEAAQQYQLVLRDDPADPDAPWRLGVVRWQQRRRGEALGWWQRALQIDGRHGPALADLGLAYVLQGDDVRARATLERAVAADRRVARRRPFRLPGVGFPLARVCFIAPASR